MHCCLKVSYALYFDLAGVEILTVEMKNKCYPLNLMKIEHKVFISEDDVFELWHKRLGHVITNH